MTQINYPYHKYAVLLVRLGSLWALTDDRVFDPLLKLICLAFKFVQGTFNQRKEETKKYKGIRWDSIANIEMGVSPEERETNIKSSTTRIMSEHGNNLKHLRIFNYTVAYLLYTI